MRITPVAGQPADGIVRGELAFDAPLLAAGRWPHLEVRGASPGPRLCVIAGMHVNEVSSIAAALRLPARFASGLRGVVSIIPVVNLPALYEHTEYACPIDGKNINFTFPGRPDGTFSEVLCHALLGEWAAGAAALIDLHGGDLRENVAKFIMYQRTDDPQQDADRAALARAFDADIVVGLEPALMAAPGRSCTAFARLGRHGLLAEAGANGVVDEVAVQYHVDGVLNVARALGMIDGPAPAPRRRQVHCDRYLWVPMPVDGFIHFEIEPAASVVAGQRLGRVHDLLGRDCGELLAPADGFVLWRMTHPVLRRGEFALGLALPVAG